MKSLAKVKRDFGNVINSGACVTECGCRCACSCGDYSTFTNHATAQTNNYGPSAGAIYEGY